MSRAFVKDDDDRPEPTPGRLASDRPNYVTQRGLALLREQRERAREAGDARDLDYYDARIASAILPDEAALEPGRIAFGSTVSARDETGSLWRVRIVGEDEADPARGSVSWSSPLAQALEDHRVGDRVVVQRPAGAIAMTVEAVDP